MKSKVKQILRAIAVLPTPSVTSERYEDFFRHPCWLAIKQEAARHLDSAVDAAFMSENMNEICKMRGVIQGLMFILQADEHMKTIISTNVDAVNASPPIEKQIREILNILEKENGPGK